MNQQQSFRSLAIYFGMFATITAGLVGLGQNSWTLPLIVGATTTVAIIYTDILGWFFLHRFLVYAFMIIGAGIAIHDYMNDISANKLLGVGNLLVYVQLPLMFQKKSKRVFEQWGVFMLLELVVAALVNDNVLYGVLMVPVLAIGCAAMMALSLFASHLRHNESFSESTGYFARWLHWLGKEQTQTRRSSGVTLSAIGGAVGASRYSGGSSRRWRGGAMPTAFAVLVFSISYFYLLPRLHHGAFEGEGFGFGLNKIGFSDLITLRFIGELLQNESPAFRMSMTNANNGLNYRPNEPPYIRATVVHKYMDGPDQGAWQPGEQAVQQNTAILRDLPTTNEFDDRLTKLQDKVVVNIVEKCRLGLVVPSLPPFAQIDSPVHKFKAVRRDWRMIDDSEIKQSIIAARRRYSFLTYGFSIGQESPVLSEMSDCIEESTSGTTGYYDAELLEFPESLEPIVPLRDTILEKSIEPLTTKVSKAIHLEDYFATSLDFQYTLNLTGPVDRRMDPIADFLLNKKKGHCQYFASALALMLRSLHIPTRLVIGYRPSEYNDLGQYFQVQQNHAHVWVEAYFTLQEIRDSQELKASKVVIPEWATRGVWVRFDPTPAVDGSNAGGTLRISKAQTLDAMQELWSDMVMNMDKSRQSSIFSIFGESSNGTYTSAWLQLQSLINKMQSSRFIGGFLSPDKWFSWRPALLIFAIGAVLVASGRSLTWLLPGFLNPFQRFKKKSRSATSTIDFYNRVIRALKRLGIKRLPFQTQREFFGQAAEKLSSAGVEFDHALLSDAFYERRFGGCRQLPADVQERVSSTIRDLELQSRNAVVRAAAYQAASEFVSAHV